MGQLPVPGRDTVYVVAGGDDGGRPVPSGPLLRRVDVAPLTVVGAQDTVVVTAVQGTGHGATAVRSASTDRTSLPVVVRGSWSSRCRVRGRL